MNKKVPYFNSSDKAKHFGAVTVMPGQTRMVDSAYIVADVRASETKPAAFDLDAYMAQNQDKKLEQLAALTAEEFAQVYAWCAVNDPPKKLDKAVEDRFVSAEREPMLVALTTKLAVINDDDLSLALLDAANDAEVLAIAQAELSKRAVNERED